SQVDFAVNIIYISIFSSMEYVVLAFLYWRAPNFWILIPLLIIIWLAYKMAISSSIQWGLHVKSIFDLYRHDLLQKVGIEIPQTWEEERNIWGELSKSFIYWFKFEDSIVKKRVKCDDNLVETE